MVKRLRTHVHAIALLGLLSASIACGLVSSAPSDVFGPDQKSAFVVYFKVDATNTQINDFLDNVIGIPGQRPGEHDLLPAIAGIDAVDAVQGHAGYSIDIWSTASQEDRTAVKTRILASPIVYKLLENTIPSQVTRLDQP